MQHKNKRQSLKIRDRIVARLKASGEPCYLCGYPIDVTLDYRNPLAFQCDEVVPISKGGSPYQLSNCRSTHRFCNRLKSDKLLTPKLQAEIKKAFELRFCNRKNSQSREIECSREW